MTETDICPSLFVSSIALAYLLGAACGGVLLPLFPPFPLATKVNQPPAPLRRRRGGRLCFISLTEW